MSEELRDRFCLANCNPCPFCGGKASIGAYGDTYGVGCPDCKYQFTNNDTTALLKKWNTRADGWQPISTAPKDGSVILLLDQKEYRAKPTAGFYKDGEDYPWVFLDPDVEDLHLNGWKEGKTGPTHWKALTVLPTDVIAENVWFPIETAPMDHSRILLFVPPYGVSCGHFDCVWENGVHRWVMHSVLNKDAQPTHWMPLPTPPEQPSKECLEWADKQVAEVNKAKQRDDKAISADEFRSRLAPEQPEGE